jgi:hypothetical protein
MKEGPQDDCLHEPDEVLVGPQAHYFHFSNPDEQGLCQPEAAIADDLAPGTLNSILKQAGLKP